MDIDLTASLTSPTAPITIAIEASSTSRLSSILEAVHKAKQYAKADKAVPMVASSFLSQRLRDVLKKENVGYLDLAGNLYLNLPTTYVEKIVDKNPFSNTPPLKNVFAPVSSRVTRAMLVEPAKAWNISELANATDVSLGQTYNVLAAMASERLARKNEDNKWVIENPADLLDAWKGFYPTYKSQKYTFFSYAATPNVDMITKVADNAALPPYALIFFSGADMVAPFIRGLNKVQFYVPDEKAVRQWQAALQLKECRAVAT